MVGLFHQTNTMCPPEGSQTQGFCVLVQLVPHLFYHCNEDLFSRLERAPWLVKREPITATAVTLSMLLRVSLIGAGTGRASLVTQSQHYSNLRAAIDVDIERLENSITHLQESLTSLAEVVMQNWRSLDRLFLQ